VKPSHLPSFLLGEHLNQSPLAYTHSTAVVTFPIPQNRTALPWAINYPATSDVEQSRIPSQISALKPRKMYDNVAGTPAEGPGAWVLKISEFQTWHADRSNAVPFCHGASKAGDAFVNPLVIDPLREGIANQNVDAVCLYCDYRGQKEQTPAVIIIGNPGDPPGVWQSACCCLSLQRLWQAERRNTSRYSRGALQASCNRVAGDSGSDHQNLPSRRWLSRRARTWTSEYSESGHDSSKSTFVLVHWMSFWRSTESGFYAPCARSWINHPIRDCLSPGGLTSDSPK